MKPVQTPCKNCVFAEYEDITQIGCSAGQLDKFRQNNIEIIEAYDHEKEFYVINGKMCQMSRSASWGIKHPKENWVEVARQETNIKYQVFVVSKGDLEKLASTIKSLYEQEIKPRHIVVISNNQDKHKEILEIFKYQKGSIVWRIEYPVNQNLPYRKHIDNFLKLDNKSKTLYYMVLKEGIELPKTVSTEINHEINENMLQFLVLKPNSNEEGLFVPKLVHQFFNGNEGKNIEDKITEVECEHLMMDIRQIAPSFPA